jgi:ADP-ribose pyrophosphatase
VTHQPAFSVEAANTLLETGFLTIEERIVARRDGRRARRQIVRHPGAVAIVPVHDGDVVLIRQYRAALDAEILEIPAGKLDVPGEDRVAAAIRELEEEVGMRTDRLEEIARFFTAPGFSDEDMTLFLATDCTSVPVTPHGLEEEEAEIVRVPVEMISDLIDDGAITDAKTLLGLLALLRRM